MQCCSTTPWRKRVGPVGPSATVAERFGLTPAPLEAIRVANADEAQTMLLAVLDNQPGAARDIVQLNAGAAIYVAGLANTLQEGVSKADQVIASGAAKNKLEQLVAVSNSFKT
jgi:anthranilate phosphoribosyltransferase